MSNPAIIWLGTTLVIAVLILLLAIFLRPSSSTTEFVQQPLPKHEMPFDDWTNSEVIRQNGASSLVATDDGIHPPTLEERVEVQ